MFLTDIDVEVARRQASLLDEAERARLARRTAVASPGRRAPFALWQRRRLIGVPTGSPIYQGVGTGACCAAA